MDQHQSPQPPQGFAPYGMPGSRQTHDKAVTAMVLGIVSVLACGLLTGIPAMVMGRRAVREIDASNGGLDGRGMAQAGFWTGLAGTALSLLAALVLAVFVLGAVGPTGGTSFEQTCTTIVPEPTDDPSADGSDPGDRAYDRLDQPGQLDEAC